MKHLDGHASAVVKAPLATCFALVADIGGYPGWSGEFIRQAVEIERGGDGRPRRAHVRVHVEQSPFAKDYEFDVAVRLEPPHAVHLSRLPNDPSDLERVSVSWSLADEQGTRIELALAASVSFLPAFLPLPGVGDLVAGTLLGAAASELGGSIAPAGAPSSGR